MAANINILRKHAAGSPNAKCSVKVYNGDGSVTTLKLVGGDAYNRKDVETLIEQQVGVKIATKASDGQVKDENNISNTDVLKPEVGLEYYNSAFPTQKNGRKAKEPVGGENGQS